MKVWQKDGGRKIKEKEFSSLFGGSPLQPRQRLWDITLRCPRPRISGRNEGGGVRDCKRAIPSPDATLGDGDGAARRPYPNLVWETIWATRPHLVSYILNGLLRRPTRPMPSMARRNKSSAW
jgi:hypothetical protein